MKTTKNEEQYKQTDLGQFGYPNYILYWGWTLQPYVYSKPRKAVKKVSKTQQGYSLLCFGAPRSETAHGNQTVYLHRLVALVAGLEQRPEQTCVNHKNLNKEDNSANNLEWATYEENSSHYFYARKHWMGHSKKYFIAELARKLYRPYSKVFGIAAVADILEITPARARSITQGNVCREDDRPIGQRSPSEKTIRKFREKMVLKHYANLITGEQ